MLDDEAVVARSESEGRECAGLDPTQLVVLEHEGLPPHFHLDEPDHEWGAGIAALVESVADGDRLESQFLGQFPADGVEIRLISLDFPARELPKASVTLMVGAPPQEDAPVPPHDRRYHRNLVHTVG